MRDNGGPAFPVGGSDGATLRDYFAAHAPKPPDSWQGGDWKLGISANSISEWNYYYADSMLRERAK